MKYTREKLALLWLGCTDLIDEKKKYKIYQHFGNSKELFNIRKRKDEWLQFVNDKAYSNLLSTFNEVLIKNEIMNLERTNIDFITIEDEKYPKLLKEINVPPIVLFYKGDISILNSRCVAIVGTRDVDTYGVEVTKNFSSELAKNGLVIVSGLAEGVDGIAQEACVNVNGKTVAVLAGGLDKIYPSSNLNLSKKILDKGGLLISERKPFYVPKRYDFPQRNRIIAGLSEAVLLTEAPEDSGARYTIEYAVDFNRTVFSVPGNVTNKRCGYNNRLIKSCASCIAITPEDILKELNVKYIPAKSIDVKFNDDELAVINVIGQDCKVHYDNILNSTKLDNKKLATILTNLELIAKIEQLPGNMYRLI